MIEGNNESLEANSDEDGYCTQQLVDEFLALKNLCKNKYTERMNIEDCNNRFYSLKKKFEGRFTCRTHPGNPILPRVLGEMALLESKKIYSEEYYHGSEGQLRCGFFTEQEFRIFVELCPARDFERVEDAQKCLKKAIYIRQKYPKLDCEARLDWYGALFDISGVNYSYQKAKEFLMLNRE